jgi:hypothetical protein
VNKNLSQSIDLHLKSTLGKVHAFARHSQNTSNEGAYNESTRNGIYVGNIHRYATAKVGAVCILGGISI